MSCLCEKPYPWPADTSICARCGYRILGYGAADVVGPRGLAIRYTPAARLMGNDQMAQEAHVGRLALDLAAAQRKAKR